jgi:uncharacterized repeat protein (TIGR01451 family)
MSCSVLLGLIIAFSGCKSKPKQVKAPPSPPDISYSWQGFPLPAPTPQDSKILIEKRVPKKIKPNNKFSFTIDVRNNAEFAVSQLNLKEKIPSNFKLIKATVPPVTKKGFLEWDLGELRPGQKKQIVVTGQVTSPGAARFFGDTDLDFALGENVTVVEVINPELMFKVSDPGTVIINENIPVKLTFKNEGKAPVVGIKLIHTLPKGLLTAEGKSKIDLDIGDLDAKGVKNKTLMLKAKKTGRFNTSLVAVASEGVSAKADLSMKVTKPELEISGKAPKKRFVGNIIPYEIDVKNVGDAVTNKVTVFMNLPEGTSLTSAGEDGTVNGQTLVWKIKSLHPGESKKLLAKVVANKIMVARAVASAETNGAGSVDAVMVTDVAGIPALLGTLIDVNDPVPVGENEIYELTVTNQGSLPATKIRVSCILEDNMEYVKSTGASKGSLKGNVLTFAPLPALAPYAKAVWRITIKAVKEGDVRFTARIESDQLQRPVELKEATHFYK